MYTVYAQQQAEEHERAVKAHEEEVALTKRIDEVLDLDAPDATAGVYCCRTSHVFLHDAAQSVSRLSQGQCACA